MNKKIVVFLMSIVFMCSGCTMAEQKSNEAVPVSAKPKVVVKDISNATSPVVADQKYTGSEVKPPATIVMNGDVLVEGVDYHVDYVDNVDVGTARAIITGTGKYSGTTEATFKIVDSRITKPQAVITCLNKEYNGTSQQIAVCSGGSLLNQYFKEAGNYIVKCKGDNTHTDAASKKCSISAAHIEQAQVSGIAQQTYKGTPITPLPILIMFNNALVFSKDYDLSYSNNINVGTAFITVTGKGNYTGTKRISFNIVAKETPKTPAVITCANKEYNGTIQQIATCSGGTIVNANQTAVGEYTISCRGDNTHTDATTKRCSINKASISNIVFSTIAPINNYTGKAIEPHPEIMINNKKLTENVDYTLTYRNNINAGTATIIIEGKGNYFGSKQLSFLINKANDIISISLLNATYTGNVVSTRAIATSGLSVSLVYYTDSSCKTKTPATNNSVAGSAPINVGTYYAIGSTSGNNNYNKTTSGCNKAIVIGKANSKITCTPKTYNGNVQVIATCEGGTIYNSSQREAGRYQINCQGDANHTTVATTCSLSEVQISLATVSAIASQTYTGKAVTPTPTVTYSGKTLVKDKDYTLSYTDNINVGTAKITLVGKGNYIGSTTKTFQIVAPSSPKEAAYITCLNKEYNGANQEIATCSGGTISNAIKKDVGTYTITCKGDNTHTDAESKTCFLKQASMVKATISSVLNQTYTGKAITPTPIVTYSGKTLVKDTDYTLSYTNNTNAGQATINVSGKGNYVGTIQVKFTINKASDRITISPKTKTYDGNVLNATATAASTSNVTFTYYKNSSCTEKTTTTEALTTGGAPKIPGKYYVIATSSGNANYNAITSACTLAVTINQVNDVITIQSKTITYNGSSVSATATAKSGTAVSLKYYSDSSCNTATTLTNAVAAGGAPKNAGKYYVIGTSKGNTIYKATSSACTLAITINKDTARITCENKTYNGAPQTIAKCNGGTVVDAIQTNAGSYTIRCSGNTNYNAAINMTCAINQVPIASATVTSIPDQGYTGNALTPYPVVRYNSTTLVNNKDYTLSYQKNINPGTAIITIAGKGNFGGTKNVTFNIISSAQYEVTYYGDTIINANMPKNVTLYGDVAVPVTKSGNVTLEAGKKYVMSFDYASPQSAAGEINYFHVDFQPDELPQISGLQATSTTKHYDWEIPAFSASTNTYFRFFDDTSEANEKDIAITNVIFGTIRKNTISGGKTLGSLPTPSMPGFTFDGWYTASVGGTKVTADTIVKSNLKLYPRFVPISSTLQISTNAYDNRIYNINVKTMGAVGNGTANDTAAFKSAIAQAIACKNGGCGSSGGGIIFVPAGKYKITEQLIIPDGVALIGETALESSSGSILQLYYGKNKTDASMAALKVGNQAEIRNLVFHYPEQTITTTTAVPYPPTILQTGIDGLTIENVMFVNSYTAMDFKSDHYNNSIQFIKDVYGTPLKTGLINNTNLDTIKVENLRFTPNFWLNSGLNAPDESTLTTYLRENASAVILERIDWYLLTNMTIMGYQNGILLRASDKGNAEGEIYNVNIRNCTYPIHIESANHTAITSATLASIGGSAIRIESGFSTSISVNSSNLSTTGTDAIYIGASNGKMSLTNSRVDKKINKVNTGFKLSLAGNTLSGTGYESVNAATNNHAVESLNYSRRAVTVPSSSALVVVTGAERTDISDELQNKINGLTNGGTVYIPAGTYIISKQITIKAGVEVRGSTPWGHSNGGTIIKANYSGGSLFVVSSSESKKAGLNGITISYPFVSNPYSWTGSKPYAIQVKGHSAYVKNIAILNAWNGVDVKSYKSDYHYVERIWGNFLEHGISVGGGSSNGVVRDCHMTTNVLSTASDDAYKKNYTYTLEHEVAFEVGNSTNQAMFNNFVWGSDIGYNVTSGTTGAMLVGNGADMANKALLISGSVNNTQLINMLLVSKPSVNQSPRNLPVVLSITPGNNRYIETDQSFSGYVNIINSISWGNSQASAYLLKGTGDIHINGGIIDHARSPIIQNRVSALSMFGLIINPSAASEIENGTGSRNANYVCPICTDGTCNVNNQANISYGNVTSCVR